MPWVLIGVLVLARLVSIVAVLQSGQEEEFSILGGDARRYAVILDEEGTPYRDFDVEYPPLALGLMHLVERPTPLGTLDGPRRQPAGARAGHRRACWPGPGRVGRRSPTSCSASPMLLYPFPYLRIDLLSVFLAVLGPGPAAPWP